MRRLKDRELKRKKKIQRHYKNDDQNKKTRIPKNIRIRKKLRFQVAGTQRLKFCKNTPLTDELKRILGRRVFAIIPDEMKQPGFVPYISVYLDKENRCLVLRTDMVQHEDFVVNGDDGKAEFVPDTAFKK